jgi:hypothetical protein
MAETFEHVPTHWSSRRHERRSAEFWGTLRPREILEDRVASKENLGPYEVRYEVTRGYGTDRVIVRP